MSQAAPLDPEFYRRLLLQRRDDLKGVAETANESAKTVELDQTRVGRLSRMDALQSQAMSVETNRRRELELRQITAALHRLEAGEYGYCIACDEQIAEKRLQADPAASRCIDCASKQEAGA